ncbi:hypothetical protein Afil01_47060 [Actinorhabdospora filicis]|uniref:DUF1468 domain-containing protein n=1 Tax=Actinorhabdospora filicis TaxID=1785913 RepID=A0A9W6SQ06_9ACTN|nr:tripartite tricarboxylate transporter TctB family protein [Actinorhabdospora filicis]GLZ79899.1 hypothetical protein Afil01_47060 [Actinorhabdospora filicis]
MTAETIAPKARRTPVGPRILGGVLVLLGLGLFWEAWRAEGEVTLGGPRLAPIIVTGLWVVFAVIYLLRQIFAPAADYPEPEGEDEHADSVHTPLDWKAPAIVAVLLAAYALLLEPAGFVLATGAFYLGVTRALGSKKIVREVIVALVLSFGVYLAFTRLLEISLPEGVLPL